MENHKLFQSDNIFSLQIWVQQNRLVTQCVTPDPWFEAQGNVVSVFSWVTKFNSCPGQKYGHDTKNIFNTQKSIKLPKHDAHGAASKIFEH